MKSAFADEILGQFATLIPSSVATPELDRILIAEGHPIARAKWRIHPPLKLPHITVIPTGAEEPEVVSSILDTVELTPE